MGFALVAFGSSAAGQTLAYDHIHLNVPDPAVASSWYEKNFGGRRLAEGPDRLMFGSTRFLFIKKADAKPSAGTPSITLLLLRRSRREDEGLRSGGRQNRNTRARVASGIQDRVPGRPMGTRIEVVQDPELLGLHHVHMRGPSPDEIFTWLLAKYGGERAKMKGRIDGIKYSVPGFSTVWILAQRGDAEPSENHAIDHIGWRSAGALTKTIDGLRAQGVTVLTEPRPLPLANGPTINFAYVAGPAGAKIEMVERPGLRLGE
jgi:catechol 2,3-dioxygenase-like lactoylglutathione lyase family enzyme